MLTTPLWRPVPACHRKGFRIVSTRAPIQHVERSPLAQQIARRLEMAIREGRLAPGERLSSERVLSEQFGVSRPVLREALQRLQELSLVITRRGQGTFVREFGEELAKVKPADWLSRQLPLVREFYEARLLIEPECAARAATNRSEAQLVRLNQLLDAAERTLNRSHSVVFTGLDIDFHTCVAEMSGNHLLQRMLAVIINPETDLRQVLHRVPGHLQVAQARHRRIAVAIADRDPHLARRSMTSALQNTLQDIDSLLKGGEGHPKASGSNVLTERTTDA